MRGPAPAALVDPSGDEPQARRSVYLAPGQLFASADPTVVTTLLGSCVAVCLWDPERRQGGVNHFLLPRGTGVGASALRFGDAATRALLARLEALGSPARTLEAKVFGGACVLAALSARQGKLGLDNAAAAREVLDGAGVRILAWEVGGNRARKLHFQTDDGVVWMRMVG